MTGGGYRVHYETIHPRTPEHAAGRTAFHRAQLVALLPETPSRVLDVGCAEGFAVAAAEQLGHRASGIDIDAELVAIGRSRGLDLQHVDDAVEYLTHRESEHDVILLLDVLEHLDGSTLQRMVQAARTALRPGGRVIITVPNAASPISHYFGALDYTHVRSFTAFGLRTLLRGSGFGSVDVVAHRERMPVSRRPWRRAYRDAIRRWFVRRVWRAVLRTELGDQFEADRVPLEANLTVVAR